MKHLTIRILITPETKHMTTLYTITRDNNPICFYLPLADALRYLRVELESHQGEAAANPLRTSRLQNE